MKCKNPHLPASFPRSTLTNKPQVIKIMFAGENYGYDRDADKAEDDGMETFDVLVPVFMRVRIRAEDSLAAECMAENALRGAACKIVTKDGSSPPPVRVESILKVSVIE